MYFSMIVLLSCSPIFVLTTGMLFIFLFILYFLFLFCQLRPNTMCYWLFAYYVKNGVLAPVSGDYVFSELVNPVFTKNGDNLKVSVSVKYLDNKSKMTQISQYELVLHKDDNWKIVE